MGRLYKKKIFFKKRKSLLHPYPVMIAHVVSGLDSQGLHADKGAVE